MANIPLKTLAFSDLIDNVYTVPQVDDTLTQTGYAADAKVAGDEITALKADFNDKDALTVGTAKQLVGGKFTEDKVPYLFRQSGGGLSVGNRKYLDAVVGGTVVWNQIFPHKENTYTKEGQFTVTGNNDGSYTITVTAETASTDNGNHTSIGTSYLPPQHKCLLYSDNPLIGFRLKTYGANASSNKIYQFPETVSFSNICFEFTNLSAGTYTTRPQIFDLTAMFDTEIADYIYALEQANAGDGVALFKKLFPNDYYAYNPGELISVSGVSAHETVGFNQWDEEYESGSYDQDGTPSVSATRIRTKNRIKVLPNTNYYFRSPNKLGIRWYDADDNFISGAANANIVITSPINARYLRFSVVNSTTYNHDICVNISDPSRNGTYEPYIKRSYPLDSTLNLRGIPKLVNGKVQYDGDRYLPDGTVERRYGVVDLGTLNWGYQASNARFYTASIVDSAKASGATLCAIYTVGNTLGTDDNVMQMGSNSNLYIKNTAYTTAASFKAAMSGVMLVYELATPTTETATPYRSDQLLDAGGTEEFVSTSLVPVGHETRYAEDLVKKLESLPWDMSMIAPVETGTTASQAYAVGKYFILNDQFCKAKTAIASGATFTLNTNYEVTTVADELYTALH